MRQPKDMKNKRFGSLVVLGDYKPGDGRLVLATWLCKCDCGNTARVASVSLRSGNTKSCGCRCKVKNKTKEKHGDCRSVEYSTWSGMKSRCDNPNTIFYPLYGGRGITYSDDWRSYKKFLEDMGRRPGDGYSLDRIDGNGNYEAGNCRWATAAEQSRNLSHTKLDEESVSIIKTLFKYSDLTSGDIASIFGVAESTIGNIRSGHRWVDVTPLPV